MTWFRIVVIEDFKCFEGRHTIELKPMVYTVQAQLEDNSQRSNWLGKSSFLEALRWVMTGEHFQETLVKLVNRGADECMVRVTLSDGVMIERTKVTKGDSVVLVMLPFADEEANSRTLKNAAAQRYLDKHYLQGGKFDSVNFIKQKKAGELAEAKGRSFEKMVGEWIDLQKIEAACDVALANLNELGEQEAEHARKIAELRTWNTEEKIATDEELNAKLEEAKALKAEIVELERQAQQATEYERLRRANDDHTKALQRLEALREEPDPDAAKRLEDAVRVAEQADAAALTGTREVRRLEQLKHGEFDGNCPVSGINCPAADRIRGDLVHNAKLHRDAAEKQRKLNDDADDANEKRDDARVDARKENERTAAIQVLEKTIERLKPDAEAFKRAVEPSAVEQQLKDKREELGAVEFAVHGMNFARVQKVKNEGEIVRLEKLRVAVMAKLTPWREAAELLGPAGAQRAIAEAVMNPIVEAANQALVEAGLQLRMRLSWDIESQQLATVCEHCGQPFPRSAKVKQCSRCQHVRGMKKRQQLRMRLSNVSGGAEDVGGVLLKLAVGAWLRSVHGIGLNVLMGDELLGALDPHNSRAMGNRLMLQIGARFGYEQAFIVEHDRGVVEAAPGRIIISAEVDGIDRVSSRIEAHG